MVSLKRICENIEAGLLTRFAVCRSPIHRLARRRIGPDRRFHSLRTILRTPSLDPSATLDQPDRHHLFRHRFASPRRWSDRQWILLYLPACRCRTRKQVGYAIEQHWKLIGNHYGRRCWFRRQIHA